jgi:predicted TIM-barrel fold metal-dependent hydrolase
MMRRRAFLASAAAAFGAAQPIVDTHVHFYDPTRPQGVPWPSKSDSLLYKPVLPKSYQALVEPLGVRGAVVVEASPWREDNQWVLDLARDNPIIVALVGHLDPGTPAFRPDLQRFSKDRLFRGIRVGGSKYPVDDMRALADAGLSLDAIGNATIVPALLALTDRLPNLRVIVNHMPVEPSGWQAGSEMRELAKRPQVYAKVSGVLKKDTPANMAAYKPALDEIWSLFGPDRVVYGSNWPVSNKLAPYGTVLDVVREYVTARGPSDARKYFWENSKACYKWVERA